MPPRRGVTTAILGVAVLTLLVVLGAARRSAGGPRSAPGGAAPALPPPGAPLEETALAVAARQASAAVGEAAGLAPMAERLLEAGRDLQAQAQALVDLN